MVRVNPRIHHRPDNVVTQSGKGITGCIRLHGADRFGDESFDGKVRPDTVDGAMGRQWNAAITRSLRYALVVTPNQLSNHAAFERCKNILLAQFAFAIVDILLFRIDAQVSDYSSNRFPRGHQNPRVRTIV